MSSSCCTSSHIVIPAPQGPEINSVQIPTTELVESVFMTAPRYTGIPIPLSEPKIKVPNTMDGALAELVPMQAWLDAGPAKGNKSSDIGDKITGFIDQVNKTKAVENMSTIMGSVSWSEIGQKIEHGIELFTDEIPWLMKALNEVAWIHPGITVAVLAFKVVYALKRMCQKNDRRVMMLYVKMKDMMMVMVQHPLQDRLEVVAELTTENIKDCANLCNTFVKKKLLVKVFKGPIWAEKLAGFIKTFKDCKADFEFVLMMHTVNSVLDVKLDDVIDLFNNLASTEERSLAIKIDAKGGYVKVRQDDEALKAFITLDSAALVEDTPCKKTTQNKVTLALDELKNELHEDIENMLKKNLDRVIGAVTDAIKQGPHMKIKDLWLRPLMEVFDDNTSGYVTIAEVNKLMDMHPPSLNWRWPIGQSISRPTPYDSTLGPELPVPTPYDSTLGPELPAHTLKTDSTFHIRIQAQCLSLGQEGCRPPRVERNTWENEILEGWFQDYVKYEEDCICGNLEKIKYNIDTPETVSLVIGSGRLEKCFLILLCLILEHDQCPVWVVTHIVILRQELTNVQTMMWHVFRVFDRRFVELNGGGILCGGTCITLIEGPRSVHRTEEIDDEQFLQVSPASDIWSMSKLSDGLLAIYIADEEGPIMLDGIKEETKPSAISTIMFEEVDVETEDDCAAPDPMKSIEDFCGSGVKFNDDNYTLSGMCLPSEGGSPMQLKWDITDPNGVAVHCNGTLVDEFTITGTWVYGDDTKSDYLFILKKIPAPYMTLRPRRSVFADVQRRLWSWSYFAARHDIQRKYLEENFYKKRFISEPPQDEYNTGLNQAWRSCTAVEVRLYESICEHLYLTFPYPWQAVTALEWARAVGALPDSPTDEVEDTSEKLSKVCIKDVETRKELLDMAEAAELQSLISTLKCNICRKIVYMGHCWCCLECEGESYNSL
ncbi:hypothetical protein V8D89_004162 [Ganoderma adspersum]